MDKHHTARDSHQAYIWFRTAAEQGNAYAQFNLGLMYKKGEGVSHDDARAFIWLRLAALQGLAFAQNHLGAMYYHGRGVVQSDEEAVQ